MNASEPREDAVAEHVAVLESMLDEANAGADDAFLSHVGRARYAAEAVALTAAIAALSQQGAEPVAYTFRDEVILAKHWTADTPPQGWVPLFAAPTTGAPR